MVQPCLTTAVHFPSETGRGPSCARPRQFSSQGLVSLSHVTVGPPSARWSPPPALPDWASILRLCLEHAGGVPAGGEQPPQHEEAEEPLLRVIQEVVQRSAHPPGHGHPEDPPQRGRRVQDSGHQHQGGQQLYPASLPSDRRGGRVVFRI